MTQSLNSEFDTASAARGPCMTRETHDSNWAPAIMDDTITMILHTAGYDQKTREKIHTNLIEVCSNDAMRRAISPHKVIRALNLLNYIPSTKMLCTFLISNIPETDTLLRPALSEWLIEKSPEKSQGFYL
jgi:hypothetical protein